MENKEIIQQLKDEIRMLKDARDTSQQLIEELKQDIKDLKAQLLEEWNRGYMQGGR